jgi:hypothetical protein
VPVFASEQDVYDNLGRLLSELVADPRLATQLQRANTIVQYRYSDPEATITVDVRRDVEPRVVLGTGGLDVEPEIVLSMAADTGHRCFLGAVNVTVAIARREISADGPVAKLLKLVPLLRPSFPRYAAQFESGGRAEPVTV